MMERMRRHLAALAASVVSFLCVAIPLMADTPPSILISDSAMVPMRAVFEWLNASVTYTGGRITALRGTDTVSLTIGSEWASINGRASRLPMPPLIRRGTTYVPLRFVAESMAAGVQYDAAGRRVVVREGGRTLVLPLVSEDPAITAIRVFRRFMAKATGGFRKYDRRWGSRAAFVNPAEHGWLRDGILCPYTKSRCRPVMDETRWPLQNARFRQLLRGLGWRDGDPWFVYDVERPAPGRVEVWFEDWNFGTGVHLEQHGSGWRATAVESFGEGMEGGPPDMWRVTSGGTDYRFAKIR